MACPPFGFFGRRHQPLTAFCTVYVRPQPRSIKAQQVAVRLEPGPKDDAKPGAAKREDSAEGIPAAAGGEGKDHFC